MINYNMESYIFITLMIFSPGLLFYAIMFYYAGISDKKFSFLIKKKPQIYKYVGVVICLGLFVSYIFIYRLANTTRIIDLYLIKEKILFIIGLLSLSDIIIFGLFIIFVILGWWSTLSWLYICLRRRLIALYLYFFQYKWFYKICEFQPKADYKFYTYLERRIKIFTSNPKILGFFWNLWPWCIWNIEKQLFRFILPYLLVFDILVYDGIIHNVFILLPWFYIYTILRISITFFRRINNPNNINLSIKMYGYGNRY